MLSSWAEVIEQLGYSYVSQASYTNLAHYSRMSARSHYDVGYYNSALDDLIDSVLYIITVLGFNQSYGIWGEGEEQSYLPVFAWAWPSAVTMDALLNAVTHPDTPDNQREEWVLIWDAYRATMYEKPFSSTFHQFWINYFKSWT